MDNNLTLRFLECISLLKSENKIRSLRHFAQIIEVHPQCISDISTGKRSVNADIIAKSAESFQLNPNYIFLGLGSKFSTDKTEDLQQEENDRNRQKSETSFIKYIPYEIQEEYPSFFEDETFLNQLPKYHFPDQKFSRGEFRCFDVTGDNMEPTLFSGEKVICCQVCIKNINSTLRKNYVYVIVAQNNIYIKRIESVVENDIILKSDNGYYEKDKLNMSEVKEVWLITNKISPFMPSPNNIRNALHKEVDNLRVTISEQSKMIKSLNQTVEKLLKQNRQISTRY